jgi:multidrug efflux system outer membrane protein
MKKAFCGTVLCALLAGCSLIPAYHRPPVATAATWKNGAAAQNDATIAPDWWKSFNSPELNRFMDQALAQNNDIRAAIDRIEQARGAARVAAAPLFPTLGVSGDATISRSHGGSGVATTSTAATQTSTTETSASTGSSASYGSGTIRSWDIGPEISYELDLFGGNRAAAKEGRAAYLSSIYAQQALALTTMGDVADQYFLVLNLRERVRIAEENLKSSNDILRIIDARFNAGAASGVDLAQEKTAVATAQASLAALKEQEAQGEDALAVLLGQTPESLHVEANSLTNLDIPDVAPTQPSSLLERRPDIRSAEQTLIAGNADIGVARAAFFPTIDLGAGLTLAASPFSGPVSRVVTGSSSLLAPIFEGGSLTGRLLESKGRKAELVEDYRKTVLTSFKETEDALVAVKASTDREAALKEAVVQSRRAYDLSRDLYDSGAVDFQTLLDAQQAMLTTEDSYASVRLERLEASVSLYLALGGGWHSDRPVLGPETHTQTPATPAKHVLSPVATPNSSPLSQGQGANKRGAVGP